MREAVLVPTYKRDELLYCCLEHIRAANPDIDIVVFADREWCSAELLLACTKFRTRLFHRPRHATYGNSLNVMESYRWGFEQGYDRVYLIEDDVMVKPDFFEWHGYVQLDSSIFCSCGWVLGRGKPRALWFASIGVCFSRPMLEKVVAHAKLEYYTNQSAYITERFTSKIATHGAWEQDGLILRIMEAEKLEAAWPDKPKCRHLGWWGYNRMTGVAPSGTFDQRIEAVRRMMRDRITAHKHFGERLVNREMDIPNETKS